MTENKNNLNNSDQVEMINPARPEIKPTQQENNLLTVEDQRMQYEAKLSALKKKNAELLSANIKLGDKAEREEYEKEQERLAKKAIETAYWREKEKVSPNGLLGANRETEGQWISRRVKEILLTRCAEGRYGNFNCVTE